LNSYSGEREKELTFYLIENCRDSTLPVGRDELDSFELENANTIVVNTPALNEPDVSTLPREIVDAIQNSNDSGI
jgi:hypothetical protein